MTGSGDAKRTTGHSAHLEPKKVFAASQAEETCVGFSSGLIQPITRSGGVLEKRSMRATNSRSVEGRLRVSHPVLIALSQCAKKRGVTR